MTMVYFPPLMDVTGNYPILYEEIFPQIGKTLMNNMFAQTPTSLGMVSGVVITLNVIKFHWIGYYYVTGRCALLQCV